MHYVKYKQWWDTKTFKQAGNLWLRDGEYCPFPEGTPSYYEFWDEQEHYIKNGFDHEGQHMTGLHYLYSNYCPIKNKKEKTVTMPDFWVIDDEFFVEVSDTMGLLPNPDPFRPAIVSFAKTRQCGASLKSCVPLLYNMCFVPYSQNYIGSYLSSDTKKTTAMFLNYFYHAQRYTEFGKRFIIANKDEYYKTGYYDVIDGDKVPAGYQSELFIISWKDSPEKGVGAGCDLFLIEEAGLHPSLLTTIGFIEPACKDGDYTTGAILVYGAAGKEGQYEGLKKLHYNPRAYRAKAKPNIWEPNSYYKETGIFIPNYSCRKGHIDADGNPNQETAIKALESNLKALEKVDYEKYLLDYSQFPNTPTQMFSTRGRKRYNQHIIAQQIAFLESNQIYGTAVELFPDIANDRIGYVLVDEKIKQPIRRYPLTENMDKEGCVEIFEFPDANPPAGLYIGGIDSYNQEDTATSSSLGSVIIYKKIHNLSGEGGTFRTPVAEYTGRPDNKYDFYKICAYLAKMYNAVLMLENEDQEATPWFYNNNYDQYLADQPELIRNIIPNTKMMGKRAKGIHAVEPLIIAAENKIQRYLDEDLGYTYSDEGVVTGRRLGVTRIMSLGLLYELKDYVHDNSKNFDRVRTFGWTLLYEDETFQDMPQETEIDDRARFLTQTQRFSNLNQIEQSMLRMGTRAQYGVAG